MRSRAAAIDIGTQSVLLLIADWDGARLHPVMDLARAARLGEGLSRHGQISPAAAARTLAVLREYRDRLEAAAVDQVRCFGTAALRQGHNAADFIEQVQAALGWSVQVLSGAEEADYTYRGALSLLPDRGAVVVDIGGGSTEVIWGDRDRVDGSQSLPVGAVLLKEQFQLGDCLSGPQQQQVLTWLTKQFASLSAVPPDRPWLITGGTATTLAALDQQLTAYDIAKIDGYYLREGALQGWYTHLNQMPLTERQQLPGMEAGRADLMLPALLILMALLQRHPGHSLRVTVRGARYGILQAELA